MLIATAPDSPDFGNVKIRVKKSSCYLYCAEASQIMTNRHHKFDIHGAFLVINYFGMED